MLDRDLELALCPKPCERFYTTEWRRQPDGSLVHLSGETPPKWCGACPRREIHPGPEKPIRHLMVVRPG